MELEQARALGRGLLDAHGLTDWSLTFDRAKRRAGVCRYDTRTISLSRHLTELHEPALVRDTLLHEIAHALAGPQVGHGPAWRVIAEEIGARPQRLLPADAPVPPAPWKGHCPGGHQHTRYRQPARPLSCTRCCPQFCVAHLITWTHRGEPAEMSPGYRQSLAQTTRRQRRPRACAACGQVPPAPRTGRRDSAAQPTTPVATEPGPTQDESASPLLLW